MKLDSDLKFYVYLKTILPNPYHIVAEPSAGYYSEDYFRYHLYKGETLVRTIEGLYSKIGDRFLINTANEILTSIGEKC